MPPLKTITSYTGIHFIPIPEFNYYHYIETIILLPLQHTEKSKQHNEPKVFFILWGETLGNPQAYLHNTLKTLMLKIYMPTHPTNPLMINTNMNLCIHRTHIQGVID